MPASTRNAEPDDSLARVTYLPGAQGRPDGPRFADETPEPVPEPEPHDVGSGHARGAEPVTDEERREARSAKAAAARDKAAERKAKRAENVSIHALTRRGMSRWELEKTLLSRELEPDEVTAELDRLASVGLVDDGALAETLVRNQHERKGLGRSALTAELRRRHIDQHHIDAALEQIADSDELDRARELANRRAPQLRSLDTTTAVRRLSAFLQRKGYSSGVIRIAVDEALASGRTATVRFE
ncbi:regulatory protein RecX [Marisediminicola sp. LYQ85]|uniref:regulatory protein RecX n=1 Tax=Marisediminicola sp. LYQ85 TaxID=3391062 RepID=UPI0039837576